MENHEEYMKLLRETKELCEQLARQFDDFSTHMNSFAENLWHGFC